MKLGGIVTYNPEIPMLERTINIVSKEVDGVILVDNNSNNTTEIRSLLFKYPNIQLIQNKENFGIANALNQIMEEAESKGADWVLTLDQDSLISKDFITLLDKGTTINKAGIIAPRIFDRRLGLFLEEGKKERETYDENFSRIFKCITSGSLTNVKCWRAVGGFDEYLFIDMVDFDFCKRVSESGFLILESKKAILNHSIGKMERRKLLGRNINVMNHPAMRVYYMTRNQIYCNYKYNNKFGSKNYIYLLKKLIIIVAFEENKAAKISALFNGMKDGLESRKRLNQKAL